MKSGRPNILLMISDQQRYDALGCNGGTIARTPVLDALSRAGITFDRVRTVGHRV